MSDKESVASRLSNLQRGSEKATQTNIMTECGVSLCNGTENSNESSVASRENTDGKLQEIGKPKETGGNVDSDADVSDEENSETEQEDIPPLENAAEQQNEMEKGAVTETKIKPSIEIDTSASSERGKMLISGCTFLSDGQVVLCDSYQDRIWLSDTDLKMKAGMDLGAKPWDVAAVDDKNVIVTLYNKQQLQFVQVLTYFKKGRNIQTGKPCYGVDVADGSIYVSCFSINNDGEIKVYSVNGKLKRRIGVGPGGTYSFRQPYYVALQKANVNVAGDFYDIHVSDFASNIVTCLTAEGSFRYQYKYVDLDGPLGLHSKKDQRQFVCGWRSHTVIVADGAKCSTLLTARNGLFQPYCVAYNELQRKLIVCCLNKLFAFHNIAV